MPGRLRALRARGGRLVVVDPVRTRTARAADEHLAIRPGGDAFLLASIANVLVAEDLAAPGAAAAHLADGSLAGRPGRRRSLRPRRRRRPDRRARPRPSAALARELAAAPSAAVYGRMGTTTSGLATPDGGHHAPGHRRVVAHRRRQHPDRVARLARRRDVAAACRPVVRRPRARPASAAARRSRDGSAPGCAACPSIFGEFPAAALAEEIDTPGDDGTRIRALITVAGNPVVSTPDSARLARALGTLDLIDQPRRLRDRDIAPRRRRSCRRHRRSPAGTSTSSSTTWRSATPRATRPQRSRLDRSSATRRRRCCS